MALNLTYYPYTLEFKRPFGIASGSRSTTPVVMTEIVYDNYTGYGEASMPPYLGENHESAISFLKKAEAVLRRFKDPMKIEEILSAIDSLQENNTAAKASIDIALHDLVGKLLNQPCYKMWNINKDAKDLYTTYTIGIDEPEIIRQKIDEANDFKILKVKLGTDQDRKIIETIRSVTNKAIAVDVNQGWEDKFYALEMINWLKEQNVLFVEQPLPKHMMKEMQWLTERSPLPTIADESMQRLQDIENIKNVFNGVNIKLMKCTGLNEARKIIKRAKELDMKILLGCMSETSCATSAAAQLSPLADWIDLDGPLLIKNNLFEGIKFVEGKIVLNDLPGIGVKKKLRKNQLAKVWA